MMASLMLGFGNRFIMAGLAGAVGGTKSRA
jgi:hypothetical protein